MKTILFIFLGASLGSFLGLIIDRFPDESLLFPASHCNHCKQLLKWWNMIPILSQLILLSKCCYCKAKIPYWYLGLELVSAGLMLLLAHSIISTLQCSLIFAGLVLTIYDIKHQEYPLMVWLSFTVLALLLSNLNWIFCGFIVLGILAETYKLNIGSGDFFYLASLSLLFSLSELLWIIQLASLVGLFIFFVFKPKSLAYVPCLFLASLIVQLF
ncbi:MULTISPECIES: A24 family peptidase [unclassified Streptococcus]|uniref:prepilin peptidase n=1 Tax=unclassified Streptococcus TaxID=2608887 RepID=UPI0010716BF2|nr:MULTISPECIES: A24 family peptidase [unclassified Streptococcus]MBF0788115.1 prepilin peptidase [Streptococcus sp. 19428wC2_LYSM12]MCQ9212080.1 prepilin peptidase [Streptococcus sp. B01]MCQ9213409.1 prepilin peptidase [Streptococcus sp. O1]TFV04830.1 prepilin peptidase [Streptococcus sp. LYSM12]